jgi:hypothetical protein
VKKDHDHEAEVMGAAAATPIGIGVVASLLDRCSVPRRVGAVSFMVVSLRGPIMLHARRANSGTFKRGGGAKHGGRATREMHNKVWDWRDAYIGQSAGSISSLISSGDKSSSGSSSCIRFLLSLEHSRNNLLVHPFLVGFSLSALVFPSATRV